MGVCLTAAKVRNGGGDGKNIIHGMAILVYVNLLSLLSDLLYG